uniref:Uncharacterized protein n=1 Tax=Setaria italica TaxID=4555 RepID=K3ZC80_SETIT
MVDALYKPTVSANIISSSLALTFLGDEPLAPIDKTFRSSSADLLWVWDLIKHVYRHRDVKAALEFHVFEVQNFDILIGHPVENCLLDAPNQRKLDVTSDVFHIY